MNKQPVAAVLFDLDGTLIDTAPDFIRIIKQLCKEDNKVAPSEADIRAQVSAGARAMVKLIFQGQFDDVADDDAELLAYRQRFLDAYEADICVDSQLFEGLDALLLALEKRGTPWGIVTNKPRYLAQILLDKLNLTARCSVLVCPDDVANTKPNPEPMHLAADTLGVAAHDCLYIGDHIRDIQAGKAANMRTVIAKFGYLSADDLANLHTWGADAITDTPQDLADWVLAQL